VRTPEELRQRIHEAGLGHLAEPLMEVASPAIRLTPHQLEEAGPPGSTRLGGLPDLPPGVAWPVVDGVLLEFVGQFRLEDVAPYDVEGRLPQTGMLYFFFDGMLTGYDRGEGKDRRAVLYYDGAPDVLERREVPTHDYGYFFHVYNPCALSYETVWTLPSGEEISEDYFFPAVVPILGRKDRTPYQEMRRPLLDYSHRLLGHPDEVQGGEMRLALVEKLDTEGRFAYQDYDYQNKDELIAEMRRWRLLAQFTSDLEADMSWGSGGLIYFWIREEDLAAHRFDQVHGELVSS
jgi:uncharacterized protein YwqG